MMKEVPTIKLLKDMQPDIDQFYIAREVTAEVLTESRTICLRAQLLRAEAKRIRCEILRLRCDCSVHYQT